MARTWDDLFLPLTPTLPGDANGDGHVDEADAKIMAGHWGQSGGWAQGDFNNDGLVNALDASILAANWGRGASEATASQVPEPSVGILLWCLCLLPDAVGRNRRRTLACASG
ncbi:MAG: hypothetical protein GX621_00975 [Pirellulaceae bacterium]|nr:hypothetical protein [Pirellulaceae bacterium]